MSSHIDSFDAGLYLNCRIFPVVHRRPLAPAEQRLVERLRQKFPEACKRMDRYAERKLNGWKERK